MSFLVFLEAHEGHLSSTPFIQGKDENFNGPPLLQNIGKLHFLFLHFPLALIPLVGVAEILHLKYRRAIFYHAAIFMLYAALIMTLPTAILGFIYRSTSQYEGWLATLITWHMWSGFLTALVLIMAIVIRRSYGTTRLYYILLLSLFALVGFTGFLGAEVTFATSFTLSLKTYLTQKR